MKLKKVLSVLLSVALVMTSIPFALWASADENTANTEAVAKALANYDDYNRNFKIAQREIEQNEMYYTPASYANLKTVVEANTISTDLTVDDQAVVDSASDAILAALRALVNKWPFMEGSSAIGTLRLANPDEEEPGDLTFSVAVNTMGEAITTYCLTFMVDTRVIKVLNNSGDVISTSDLPQTTTNANVSFNKMDVNYYSVNFGSNKQPKMFDIGAMSQLRKVDDNHMIVNVCGMYTAGVPYNGEIAQVYFKYADGATQADIKEDTFVVSPMMIVSTLNSFGLKYADPSDCMRVPADTHVEYDLPALPVNKTALQKAIADANAVDADLYTEASVAAMNEKLAAAQTVNDNADATQEEVDAATKSLNDAIAALEEKPAPVKEYTITFTYATADGEKSVTQTVEEGKLPVAPTVSDYVSGGNTYQFKGWTPAISEATADTVYTAEFTVIGAPANYDDYNRNFKVAQREIEQNEMYYTPESYANLKAVVEANTIPTDLTAADQDIVDTASDAILAALRALVNKWPFLEGSSAIGTLRPANPDEEEPGDVTFSVAVNTVGEAITTYCLTFMVDTRVIKVLNNSGDVISTSDLPQTTTNANVSFNKMDVNYYSVNFGSNKQPKMFDIGAMSQLRKVDDNHMIVNVCGMYTAGTPYNGEIAQVYFKYADGATQADIKEDTFVVSPMMIVSTLNSFGLKYADPSDCMRVPADTHVEYDFPNIPTPVDKTALQKAIADAKAVDADLYTEASVAAMNEKLAAAQTVNDNADATQEEVDAATTALNDAIAALEEKPAPVKEYTITFTYATADGEKSVTQTVEEGSVPVAPTVANYSNGDYDYTFKSWDKEVAAATADTTYTAVFEETFVAADTSALEAAINAANTEIAKDIYTTQSVETLETLINSVKDTYGRTEQTAVDSLKDSIEAATQALTEQKYTVTFVYKDAQGKDTSSTQEVVRHGAVTAPTGLPQYSDGVNTYTFSKWDSALSTDVTSALTYTAQYTTTVNPADFTKYNEAVAAARAEIATGKYTDDSVAALEELLAKDTSSFDASTQADLDALTADIKAATEALAVKTFTVTFDANGTKTERTVKYGETPEAPEVSGYEDGDYDCTFKSWDKEIAAATADVTYTALYDRTFVEADYDAYNNTVNEAKDKIASGAYTDESVAALSEALSNNAVATGLGRTSQDAINTATAEIRKAIDALQVKPEVKKYTIKFVVNGVVIDEKVVEEGVTPKAPEVNNYSDGDYDYTYTGWDAPVVAALADATYTAEFTRTFVKADTTALDAAVTAANAEIAKNIYTADSVDALQAVLGKVKTEYGRTEQGTVDNLTAEIKAATESLVKKSFDIIFVYNTAEGEKRETVKTVIGEIPEEVTVPQYTAGDYTYTFKSWDKVIVEATEDTTYTAQYNVEFTAADYTEYNKAVEAANAVVADKDAYVTASVEAVEKALADNKVETGLGASKQGDIDAATKAINDAVAAAEKLADKTLLEKVVDDADKVITPVLDSYTTSTAKGYTDALAAAKEVLAQELGTSKQSVIDNACKALEDAILALRKKANLDELKATIETAKNTSTDGMTPASVKALEDAVKAGEAVVALGDEAAQDAADAATKAIKDAVAALTVDKSALDAAIAVAEKTPIDGYTKDTVDALKKALADAKAVSADTKATVDEVRKATKALTDALAALKVDKTALIELDNTAKALDTSDKTDVSKKVLEAAIANADKVIADDKATVADVVNAYAELDRAIKGLEKLGDKTELQKEYDLDKDIDTTGYTDKTVKAFNDALEAAKKVLDDSQATQPAIDKALADLVKAKNGLTKVAPVAKLDWTEWNKLVKIFNGMKESGSYNAADISEIQIFIDKVIAGDVSSQAKLDSYTATLRKMIKSARVLKKDQHTLKFSKSSKSSKSSSSKTGDNASLIVMGGILVSAIGLAAISFKRKKEEE